MPREVNILPTIEAYFEVMRPGHGVDPPLWVDEEGVGLILPLRYNLHPEVNRTLVGWKGVASGVPVSTMDAVEIYTRDRIRALKTAGRLSAADWWWQNRQPISYDRTGMPRGLGRLMSIESALLRKPELEEIY